MPDVKPCDYPPAGPAPSSSDVMDLMEPCMADLVSQNPLCSSFPHSSQQQLGPAYHHAHHHHHPSLHHNHHQGGGAAFPLMSRCNSSSTLLTNLGGLRYGPPQGAPRGQQQQGQGPPSCGPPGWQGDSGDPAGGCGGGGGRPYRSMENLNWSNVQGGAEPPGGLYGGALPYRSVDSEFIFRCSATTTSHWCDGDRVAPPLDHHGCSNNKAAGGGGYYGLIGPNPESLAFYPRRCLGPRADLPTLFPQWLFPGGGGAVDESWEARKGLRDKLRLQSARSASEPLKPHPLRPQVAVVATPGGVVQVPPCDRGGGPPPPPPHASLLLLPPAALGAGPVLHQRAPCVRRITSPEDIKQEVLRRLQLRRQNSSPNLSALHHHCSSPEEQRPPEGLLIKTSYTTDNIAGGKRDRPQEDSAAAAPEGPEGPEPRRPPAAAGRLHIPTFEEFKRMRQTADEVVATASEKKADAPSLSPRSTSAQREDDGEEEEAAPSGRTDARSASDGERGERGGEGTSSSSSSSSNTTSVAATTCTLLSPIRTGPAPRSPLQTSEQSPAPVAGVGAELGAELEAEEEGCVVEPSRRRSSLEPAGSSSSVPLLPNHHHHHRTNSDHSRVSWERPSSCCPALLLEGSDLSRYGAKIYKMKDGLIGSALDLIKKSCSAESPVAVGETPVRVSGDQEGGGGGSACDVTAPLPTTDCQSSAVSMATAVAAACGAEEEEESEETEEPAECQHPGLGCRRSSSDAAYELARTSRTQRECRLRPHYSDPMPADAAKRKQLEMKIAAAARLHSQRRDRERDRDRDSAPAAVRGRSEPRGEERQAGGVGAARSGAGQHRWSTVSSLSADSGVVGLSDEREDQEDCSSSEPRRHHTHHHQHHHHQHHRRSRGSGADVERADSGIGPGLARGWKRPSASLRAWEAQRPCPDCGQRDLGGGGGASRELRNSEAMCERCSKLRTERKEAILEFLNTETSYGEDLRIIREEFYSPMQSAGLLTSEHLATVFGNVQELIEVNERFTEHLQDSIDQAFDQGDEDLLTVYIGEIFLEFVNMLPAFQTYCLQQSTSVNMLNSLEKEKELLRIFLDVSQNDNTALRRMNLRSFLMAPLQRVTKYPLLLSRISKATTDSHPDHGRLREAKSRVESHLEHINMKTKQEGGGGTGTGGVTWSLRSFRRDSRKNREVINIEMREVSMKTVGWARENTRFVMEGPLQLSQPADGQWVKKGSRALKFQNVQSLLMVRTQRGTTGTGVGESQGGPTELGGSVRGSGDQTGDRGGGGETVWDGVLVLIKDKSSGKFAVLREPIRLGNCVVSAEPDCEDTFELLDIRRESFVFRATDKSRTQQWFRQIKRYARDLGPWRRRRNALPNIMINTNQTRS